MLFSLVYGMLALGTFLSGIRQVIFIVVFPVTLFGTMKPPVVANISFFPNPRLEKEDLRGTYGECGRQATEGSGLLDFLRTKTGEGS